MDTYSLARLKMVAEQVEARGVHNPRVLAALRTVPRHLFVPPSVQSQAYEDYPLPIGHGQTLSQPYIVGLMTELLNLKGSESVLEIGTGSGYQTAVLACLAHRVITIERIPALFEQAQIIFNQLNICNVECLCEDGSLGWQPVSPYDAILVTAAAPKVPPPLLDQLMHGGRLVIPVGDRWSQTLQRWTREGDKYICEDILPVAFVPLRGVHGWQNPADNDQP